MFPSKYAIYKTVAKAATTFLLLFFAFCIGLVVAQLDSVQRTLRYIRSAEFWAELLPDANEPLDKQITVWSTEPDALKGGAVLIGTEYSNELGLLLIDGQGRILHKWNMENRLFNPSILRWWKNVSLDEGFAIDDARLLPGGDVIFIQLLMSVNNYRGQRLARMDRDSHVIWQVPENFHHFIDIAGDPQRIYTLTSRLRGGFPEIGQPRSHIRYLEDFVVAYSLDGKKLDEWSMVDAFEHSAYRNWLSSFEIDKLFLQHTDDGRVLYDLFHINSVQYLDAIKAKALPGAQNGDLLISFRGLSALAVFRPVLRQIVWASKGPWHHQHDAHVGEDGTLYMFDNEGRQAIYLEKSGGLPDQFITRVIRFNPFNNRMEEIYGSPELYSFYMGNYVPLDDGSWIISAPQRGSVVVISPEKKVVWRMRTVSDPLRVAIPLRKTISMMHYYPPSALRFLDAAKTHAP